MFDFPAIRAATEAARTSSVVEGAAKPTKAELRLQAIAEHIGANFGCNQQAVRQLVELMEGPLPQPSGLNELPLIGTAVHISGDIHFVAGKVGDELSAPYIDSDGAIESYTIGSATEWRYASDEEIDKAQQTLNV